MIRAICEACERMRRGEDVQKSEHTCNIKNLPEIAAGSLIIYNYTKPVMFLFEGYAPGSFMKAIPGSTSHFLTTGKESSTIFSHTVCRGASPGEAVEYKEIAGKSRYAGLVIKEYAEML